ncbi:branched-chain amino acid ABC transporter permease [Geodermatophilus sp. TF02-6]|uniref:branched-chain amino acid ABC transporter permease n=1 Tax=Geodermatophilus sp. TF02-6 TaxID=2250575 RepID=UPI000DEA765E|nr:branched-chain amino acid ABC transporter permease [Geodermatophilus sp. TF02-6]RBY82436.1 branched-chain amino acid ABC transporter permease [Geodermatophilus sp. TF02-6]
MQHAIQQIVDGLAAGSIYGALALALVLVYRATGMINFAQGLMAVASTYIALTLWQAGSPIGAAVAVAIAVSLVLGAVTERLVIRRFEGASPHTAVVVTVALLILINGIVGAIWGYNSQPFPSLFPTGTVTVGGVVLAIPSLATIGVLIAVVVLLQLLFLKTKLGLALRAVANNPESSALSGLNVGRLLMVGWALAAGLGALAGALIAPKVYLDPGMMDTILIYALAAAVLGGLDSPMGAVVAAWIIGVSENLAGTYIGFIGNDLKIGVPLVAMFVILLTRPQGLFGRKEAVRV